MSSTTPQDARLSLRLTTETKEAIEAAAVAMGQSVSDYAIATLLKNAQAVLLQKQTSVLSKRDHKTFMALLDDADTRPNRALKEAAGRYKQQFK